MVTKVLKPPIICPGSLFESPIGTPCRIPFGDETSLRQDAEKPTQVKILTKCMPWIPPNSTLKESGTFRTARL
jgi:hypothetical protein